MTPTDEYSPCRALLVTVTGMTTEVMLAATPDGPSLDSINARVGGYARPLQLTDTVTAWMNEDGEAMELPVNPEATLVMNRLAPHHPGPACLGNTVFTGGTSRSGKIMQLDSSAMELVKEIISQGN